MSNFERQTYIKKQSIDTEFNANYHSKNRKKYIGAKTTVLYL